MQTLMLDPVKLPSSGVIVDRKVLHGFRAKTEQLEWFGGLLPKCQGRNLAVTVLSVPSSLELVDPIMQTLMLDPVKLPSSGVIVDRKVPLPREQGTT